MLMAFLLLGLAQANVTVVNRGGDIQGAIDRADPGDIIEVWSGTYYGGIQVDKPLTIVGADSGKGMPVIDAQGQGSAITLSADNITLRGLCLVNSGGREAAGINARSNGNTIADNVARDNYEIGIYLMSSSGNLLINNSAENSIYGIALNRSEDNTLRNNSMTGNKNNFLFGYGHNSVDQSNTIDGKPIYFLVGQSDLVVDSTSNAGDVICINCTNITVKDQILSDNFAGIYLENTTLSRIENNSLGKNSFGILIINSSENTLARNIIAENSYGVFLKDGCRSNTLAYNDIRDNDYGIFLNVYSYVNDNLIYGNDFENNRHGSAFSRGPARWDNGSIGNHYSDYDLSEEGCVDSNSDGLCDEPYKVPFGFGMDRYPLAGKP
jgi:parallel beta-helix repeat protein